MSEFYTLLTLTGQAKLAAAAASGDPVALTEMAVGDGDNGAYYEPDETQTALRNELWRGTLNRLYVDPANPTWVVAELLIPDNVGGWTVREVGVFDFAGDLIAIGKFPETYKPLFPSGTNKQLYIRMVLVVTNSATVSLQLDANLVMATQTMLVEAVFDHEGKVDPHQQYLTEPRADDRYIPIPAIAAPGGVASLGGDGRVPLAQLAYRARRAFFGGA